MTDRLRLRFAIASMKAIERRPRAPRLYGLIARIRLHEAFARQAERLIAEGVR